MGLACTLESLGIIFVLLLLPTLQTRICETVAWIQQEVLAGRDWVHILETHDISFLFNPVNATVSQVLELRIMEGQCLDFVGVNFRWFCVGVAGCAGVGVWVILHGFKRVRDLRFSEEGKKRPKEEGGWTWNVKSGGGGGEKETKGVATIATQTSGHVVVMSRKEAEEVGVEENRHQGKRGSHKKPEVLKSSRGNDMEEDETGEGMESDQVRTPEPRHVKKISEQSAEIETKIEDDEEESAQELKSPPTPDDEDLTPVKPEPLGPKEQSTSSHAPRPPRHAHPGHEIIKQSRGRRASSIGAQGIPAPLAKPTIDPLSEPPEQ
ncbi:hypothetical protein HDU98_002174 [Podochytrium sp. JEL0797]|nr:hypothetical protein HDU98_002174 [Podochytrium sp. JEL0797]